MALSLRVAAKDRGTQTPPVVPGRPVQARPKSRIEQSCCSDGSDRQPPALTAVVRPASGAGETLLPRLSAQCSAEPLPLTQRHTLFFSPFQEEEDRPVPEGRRGNQTENADPVH